MVPRPERELLTKATHKVAFGFCGPRYQRKPAFVQQAFACAAAFPMLKWSSLLIHPFYKRPMGEPFGEWQCTRRSARLGLVILSNGKFESLKAPKPICAEAGIQLTQDNSDPRQDYYVIGIIDFLRLEEPQTFTLDELIDHCAGFGEGNLKIRKGISIAKAALSHFVSTGVLEEIKDPFAGPHYIVLNPPDKVEEKFLDKSTVFKNYLKLGDGGSFWLGKAFSGIESSKDIQLKSEISPKDDTWEPLPLDLNEPQVTTAIRGAQEAIEGIRSDNGFAVEHPAERESLVAHAEATVASAMNGKVTKSQVKENFVKAGKWLAEKFSGTAIGALGSELAKWGLRLLGILP